MRDLVIRYIPKVADQELFQVYVPINHELVPFNFFEKEAMLRFVTSMIDGEFTDAEINNLLKVPSLPAKPKKERAPRASFIPLEEREPSVWTSAKRKAFVYDKLRAAGEAGVVAVEVFREGKKNGDHVMDGNYYIIFNNLLKERKVKKVAEKPLRFAMLPDVVFEKILPVERSPLTHRQERRLDKLKQ